MSSAFYVLRHAAAQIDSPFSNHERPLTAEGEAAALELVASLKTLGISRIFSSPYRRAFDTIAPFCDAHGITPQVCDWLRESTADEAIPDVRTRVMAEIRALVEAYPSETLLFVTHGGVMWAILSHFDAEFGHEQYLRIGNPDLRRLCFEDETEPCVS